MYNLRIHFELKEYTCVFITFILYLNNHFYNEKRIIENR